jgi:hypothetical protein
MNFSKDNLIQSSNCDDTNNNNNNNNSKYSFALCNLCFWCATILLKSEKRDNDNNYRILSYTCPLCFNSNISLIPLASEMPMKYQIVAKVV